MSSALAFLEHPGRLDYGRRLSRLRWIRALPECRIVEVRPDAAASVVWDGSDSWLVVADESALPLSLSGFPAARPGRVLVPVSVDAAKLGAHTLREVEAIAGGSAETPGPVPGAPVPAFAFRTDGLPRRPGETVDELFERLLGGGVAKDLSSDFRVLTFGDPSSAERPEITRHVPARCRSLLDVGCGRGGSSAALRRRIPGLSVTGIEKDERAAAQARDGLDRVLADDASEGLAALAREGARFEAFLFADVLEHLQDPALALSAARRLAAPGAVLVASVPNAGHLSLVRDLVLGRFDPVPAGLADAGHVRWFTRASLAEMLEESGWRVRAIEAIPGTLPGQAEEFLARLSGWPCVDEASLGTYQWIAVAAAGS